MGNSLGGKKTTKVMKIDGETFKLKTPVKVGDVLKDHPGLVLLESEEVKHYGVRARPLELHKELKSKRLYFLVELPKESMVTRRVRSVINMSAKDRLENLSLARRSASDLTIIKSKSDFEVGKEELANGGVRLKMRLPKAEVEKLMQSSKDEGEAAEKIMSLCMASGSNDKKQKKKMVWKGSRGAGEFTKAYEKRVSFMPINEGSCSIAVAS
ncbi:unnamed protein product [Lathyrus sativus]|nr:unnamed protein product [Lathyrus sativus]